MSQRGAVAVTRFGLGAQPGEIHRASDDPEQWLLSQLDTSRGIDFQAKALKSSKVQFSKALDYFQAWRAHDAEGNKQ